MIDTHDFDEAWTSGAEAALLRVTQQHPSLRSQGFEDTSHLSGLTRLSPPHSARAFCIASRFLSSCKALKRVSSTGGLNSYVLREHLGRITKTYVSNGALIAAAIDLRLPIRQEGLNAYIGIKLTTALRKALYRN